MSKNFSWLMAILVASSLLLGACSSSVSPKVVVEPELTRLDTTPRIAVMSAFDAELELLLAETEVEKEYIINGRVFTTGTLKGHEVVLFLSGVSMTNAAMTTQQALDHFNITKLIFSGISGGVSPDLNIGDVYVAEKWAEYQENYFAREVSSGEYEPPVWYAPYEEETSFGMMFPQPSSTTAQGGEGDAEEIIRWFYADEDLLAVAEEVASTVSLEDCAGSDCLEHPPVIHVGGNGVSGPTFVDNAEYREYVYSVWQPWGLDMESAGAAHVLYNNGVPFVFVRSASDLAGGDAGPNPINIFFQVAANNSAKFLLALIEAVP